MLNTLITKHLIMQTANTPAVILTFANDDDAHLALLKKESRQLREILFPLHQKGAIALEREESATVEELSYLFRNYDQRIAIFHYGGHAGGQGLRLEEGDAQAGGLASFFEQQKDNLQLVFLNGCSTLPQVQRLMSLGIKAVIATAAPIEDAKAVEFATEFYRGLCARQPIGRAFESASAFLGTKYQGQEAPAVIEYRDVEFDDMGTPDVFPWGLYVNEDHKDVLDWRLPAKPRRFGGSQQDSSYRPNQYLAYVLDAMLFLDAGLRRQLTNDEGLLVDTNGAPLNDQQKFYIILKHLPWPIGAQFQKLIAQREPGPERLRQIVSTYLATSQTLLYLIIAQLFGKAGNGAEAADPVLQRAIDISREQFRTFDYLSYIKTLPLADLFAPGERPFVEEAIPFIRELNNEKSDLYKACLELEELRDSLQDDEMDWGQAEEFYDDAEASLTILLSRVAFLVQYKMLAVRDIQVVNNNHAEIRFQHRMGELNGVGDMLGLSPRELRHFAQCNSILLVRDIEDLEEEESNRRAVNLTPFLIDENAYLNHSSNALNIYMYAYRDGDTFYYYKVNSNILNVMQDGEALLAVNCRQDAGDDSLFHKFLPIEQGAFLQGVESSSIQPRLLRGEKKANPYEPVVRQLKSLIPAGKPAPPAGRHNNAAIQHPASLKLSRVKPSNVAI